MYGRGSSETPLLLTGKTFVWNRRARFKKKKLVICTEGARKTRKSEILKPEVIALLVRDAVYIGSFRRTSANPDPPPPPQPSPEYEIVGAQ